MELVVDVQDEDEGFLLMDSIKDQRRAVVGISDFFCDGAAEIASVAE